VSLRVALANLKPFAALGAPLEELRRDLIRCTLELAQLLEPMEATIVEEASRALQSQMCRIAVVGQIKAGKSSFISALADRPHLLPSDVNPWTTVVTSLHFGGDEAASDNAVFTFFGPGEWRRIAEGGGLLRELTERLVPGFSPTLLRLQLDALRQRAERRLGGEFQSLLGQQHQYPSVTREIVDRYVSAGTGGASAAGRYSDITKVADLYFGGARAGYPVTVIDTPGTNDPFMVRDEITRQSLSAADIYVVVLTAQQPLAAADLALLRILRGLHKEHVIVFINRIDQLGDVSTDCKRLIENVGAQIEDEFGAVNVPIIVGSARWGSFALSGNSADRNAGVTGPFRAYAKELGFNLPDSAGEPEADADMLRDAFMACSGIPKTIEAIGRKLLEGGNSYVIGRLAVFLTELAKTGEALDITERRAAMELDRTATANKHLREEQVERWQKEVEQLALIADQTQDVLSAFQDSLSNIMSQSLDEMRHRLKAIVERFIQGQLAQLLVVLQQEHGSTRVWQCSAAPLRGSVEGEFLRLYRHAETRILEVETVVRKHFGQQYRLFDEKLELGQPSAPVRAPSPPMTQVASPVALDLEYPWWSAWWQGRPTPENRQRAFRKLVEADFGPLAEQLVGSAEEHLGKQVNTMVRQVSAVQRQVLNSVRRRSTNLNARLEASKPREGVGAVEVMHQSNAKKDDDRAAKWSAISHRLADITRRYDSLVTGHSRKRV
jgi:signal recognition particle receptor subunit beta